MPLSHYEADLEAQRLFGPEARAVLLSRDTDAYCRYRIRLVVTRIGSDALVKYRRELGIGHCWEEALAQAKRSVA